MWALLAEDPCAMQDLHVVPRPGADQAVADVIRKYTGTSGITTTLGIVFFRAPAEIVRVIALLEAVEWVDAVATAPLEELLD